MRRLISLQGQLEREARERSEQLLKVKDDFEALTDEHNSTVQVRGCRSCTTARAWPREYGVGNRRLFIGRSDRPICS